MKSSNLNIIQHLRLLTLEANGEGHEGQGGGQGPGPPSGGEEGAADKSGHVVGEHRGLLGPAFEGLGRHPQLQPRSGYSLHQILNFVLFMGWYKLKVLSSTLCFRKTIGKT